MEAKVRTFLQKATKPKNPFDSSGNENDDYRQWDPSGVAIAAAERERRSLATHPIPLTALQEDDVLAQLETVYYESGMKWGNKSSPLRYYLCPLPNEYFFVLCSRFRLLCS